LKSRGISAPERQSLLLQQLELDGSIKALVEQRKTLESDVGVKRKALSPSLVFRKKPLHLVYQKAQTYQIFRPLFSSMLSRPNE
jgi:hypothetical protein